MSEAHSILSLPDEAFGWYLTGLTDGEGCFIITRSNQRGKRYPKWCTRFNITMRADETANLHAIARRMGCGTFYTSKRPLPPSTHVYDNPRATWTVFRREVLARIILPHFERFPLQFKKARDFAIWKPCVLLLCEVNRREQSRRPGATRMRESEREFLEESVRCLRATRAYVDPQITHQLPEPPSPPQAKPQFQGELFL